MCPYDRILLSKHETGSSKIQKRRWGDSRPNRSCFCALAPIDASRGVRGVGPPRANVRQGAWASTPAACRYARFSVRLHGWLLAIDRMRDSRQCCSADEAKRLSWHFGMGLDRVWNGSSIRMLPRVSASKHPFDGMCSQSDCVLIALPLALSI